MNFSRPVISLLHATRGRPDQALAARDRWLQAATHPDRIEHIFAVDCDDEATQKSVAHLRHCIVPQKGGGCVAAWNLAAEASTGEVLVQLSDDWTPTLGWDEEFVRRLRDVSVPAVLRPSDGHRRDDLLCMAILTRARYVQQGEFLHRGYLGVFSDDEFSFRAYLDGVVIDARDLVLTHHHPFYDASVPHDETYARQNDAARSSSGYETFLRRHPQAMGHWLHENTWERFFVPLNGTVSVPVAQKEETVAEKEDPAQEKALRAAESLLLRKREHVELFRSTAGFTGDLLEGVRKSWAGKLVLKSSDLAAFRQAMDGARLRLKKRAMLEACASFLHATRLGLELLEKSSHHFLVKSRMLKVSIGHIRSEFRQQKQWLKKVKRLADDLPAAKESLPWGFDAAYYAKQAGREFSTSAKAARHYEKEGVARGLHPHSLFDTRFFQKQNAGRIDAQANPLEEYHRLLDEGETPEAHPKFPAAWLREYFSAAFEPLEKAILAPLPAAPVKEEQARAFAAQPPRLGLAVALHHTPEATLRRFLSALAQAWQNASTAGNPVPQLFVTDRSGERTKDSLESFASELGIHLQWISSPPGRNHAQTQNALLKALFAQSQITHAWCLHPGACLHPSALVEMLEVLRTSTMPALIESRQFPEELPKDYDAATLETSWCDGRCLVVPRFLFDLTEGFDENFPEDNADVDLSWRAWQLGYRSLTAPKVLVHLPATANETEKQRLESGRLLAAKWQASLFRLECERALVEGGLCPSISGLRSLPSFSLQKPHEKVDFTHGFSFAPARW